MSDFDQFATPAHEPPRAEAPAYAQAPTVEGAMSAAEPSMHKLQPALRTEWTVLGLLALVPIAILVLLAAAEGGGLALLAGVVILGLLAFGVWAWAASVYERWRYVLWPEAIEVRHGVVRHVATFVPFHRIQQVDVERGPLDRMFGLSTLILRTAAASTDAKIPGLDPSVVEDLRASLLARAELDDAV